jgi:hypothetical protein
MLIPSSTSAESEGSYAIESTNGLSAPVPESERMSE